MYKVDEVRDKILEAGQKFGVNLKWVDKALDDLKRRKRGIRGVWARPGWLWIAVEQPTKLTWFGIVFSPFVERGEWGSFYLWDPSDVGAIEVVKPNYRYKVTPEELEEARRKIVEIFAQ